ncbi:hypothetical protein MFU01_84300 [Myxococcus fulvus]|uniref:6-phosphogluconate dehydrogenase NADP-binding domain-containing protein n=1 Tax=Myxococcus fulvus TaxID=33 RepID=A0A511TIH1_MYXFU|nr:hypothetical protein MFU01_84300 [Myxococcus fulvus]
MEPPPEKAAPLLARGAIQRRDIEAALAASPLVITCLKTYDATLQVLAPAASTLAGRTLVTLNSGTPASARGRAEWARRHDLRFLDGAVKNVPDAVGKPDTLLLHSGDEAVFDEHRATLKVPGGDTWPESPSPSSPRQTSHTPPGAPRRLALPNEARTRSRRTVLP